MGTTIRSQMNPGFLKRLLLLLSHHFQDETPGLGPAVAEFHVRILKRNRCEVFLQHFLQLNNIFNNICLVLPAYMFKI